MKILIFVLMLSGCVSNDISNNKFFEYSPIAVEIGGIYSVAIGPYINTYKISKDGTGLSCYYQNGAVVVHKLKVYSKDGNAYGVIFEYGLKSVIRQLNEDMYSLESYYGASYKLIRDNDLVLANLSCKEMFSRRNI